MYSFEYKDLIDLTHVILLVLVKYFDYISIAKFRFEMSKPLPKYGSMGTKDEGSFAQFSLYQSIELARRRKDFDSGNINCESTL